MSLSDSDRDIIESCTKAIDGLRCGEVHKDILALSSQGLGSREIRNLLGHTQALVLAYTQAKEFIQALAKGHIHVEAPRKNQLISDFKELQSALLNLTWQIQQVADGNYKLRIDFLGKFSEAFNRMVCALAEKQHIERELSASEARSLRAETVAGFGNWELHLGDGSIHGSPGVYRIYGLLPGNYNLGQLRDMALPPDRERIDAALHNLIEVGRPYDIEFKASRADSGEILDIHSIAEYDRENQIVFGVIQDITLRKRAEEQLDYQHRFQKMLAEISSQFLDTTEKNLDDKIRGMLQTTGEFFCGGSRLFLPVFRRWQDHEQYA
jgi:PAS domain-containing protein